MPYTRLIALVSLLFVLFYNYRFFHETLKVYPPTMQNLPFLVSLAAMLWAFIALLLTLVSAKVYVKYLLILITLIASVVAYFADNYSIVIDREMIRNLIQTNPAEAGDLLSPKLFAYLLLLSLFPSWLIWRIPLYKEPLGRTLRRKAIAILFYLGLILLLFFASSAYFVGFFRNHIPLRYHTNPTYWLYSLGDYLHARFFKASTKLQPIGTDATIERNGTKRLVIMVVGEAARADHFSLNGYKKETNPLLAKEAIINLPQMYSCGTSTAVSVPCLFSPYGRSEFGYEKGRYTENVLDVLKHTGKVALLWRDNNSDSKGVALRITHEDFRSPKNNPVCDVECRDIGMLSGLDAFIAAHPDKDIMIVLHQMGNHGPAYYKRYPKTFEYFKPACHSNRPETCSKEEINNAYDNALRYSDYFLKKTIDFLKRYDTRYETALLYVADHGESLGEHGLYLHGLPYFMAPEHQKHVGAFVWFGKQWREGKKARALLSHSKKPLSHDYYFHSILGLFDVKTKQYDPRLDLFVKKD